MIDLTSDTATRPTPEMRRFMAEAPVGDEQLREDPTVNALQETAAALLGKEAALFLPSGTMCNAIGFAVNAGRGDAVILDRSSHPNQSEAGGPAWLAGVMLRPVDSPRGIFAAADVESLISGRTTHAARSAMISVENTTNRGGGAIWPLENLAGLRALADEHGMKLHMDGARLLNAAVASGLPAATFAGYADSVWLDLSKGLGAPVGAVLAGTADFIEQARLLKHLFGGAMRQAGIIAAGGVYALRHHVARLADDHANARILADGLAAIPGIRLVFGAPETNIVFFDISDTGLTPTQLEAGINQLGVRLGAGYDGTTVIRAVTHLDVTRVDCEAAATAIRQVVAERAPIAVA
ncbi:MAG TPA: GntG family PLP-dependent aldolase [Thermomicrobiales bacterium]|nr:GntG family PLP-dependent aldolase [Thermomicrobiales bacterium]